MRAYREREAVAHKVRDDLESFAHVICWLCAAYVQNTMEEEERKAFLSGFEDEEEKRRRKLEKAGV